MKLLLDVWYWTTLVAWWICVPTIIFPFGGELIMFLTLVSTMSYIGWDIYANNYRKAKTK